MSTSNPMLDRKSQQQQQQLPPIQTTQQAYTAHSGRGPGGLIIGVLAMITILGALVVMIGSLCSGRKVNGNLQYDIEGWVETSINIYIEIFNDDIMSATYLTSIKIYNEIFNDDIARLSNQLHLTNFISPFNIT